MSKINLTDISRLDFNLAVTFLALWQERSVSRAAAKLSLSQSAVSAALARLRDAAQDPLFVRTRGGMEPTPRAIAMATKVEQAVEGLRHALMMDRGFDPASSQRHFSIGMSDDFEVAIGPAISQALISQAPHASIVFRQTNRHTVEQMLEARDIELAVVAGIPPRGWLTAEEIGRSGYACLLNAALCDAPLPLTMQDFMAMPHILISFSGREGIVDEALKAMGMERTVHTALTHFSALPAYLAALPAVATLPSHAARALARVAGLASCPVPIELGTYPVWAVCRRDAAEDAGLRWLRQIVASAFRHAVG